MYGSGLRLMELMRLRVKDLDFGQGQIVVRGGKGNKDRVTTLPTRLREALHAHLEAMRALHEVDRAEQVAGVFLPGNLERKMPHAGKEWPWFWVWPSHQRSRDPRSGLIRRHHTSDKWFGEQQVRAAARRAEIPKRVTSHVLRHSVDSFASRLSHPCGASPFGRIPFAASQAAQVRPTYWKTERMFGRYRN